MMMLTIGFPVTTAGEWPWNLEYSSKIHAIVCKRHLGIMRTSMENEN